MSSTWGITVRVYRLAAALAAVTVVAGCGVLGSGGTTLKSAGPEPVEHRYDGSDTGSYAYLRMSDINICTDGDDKVRITGVSLAGANAPKVVGFRITHEPKQSASEGSSGSAQLTRSPIDEGLDPTQQFAQSCDEDSGSGRTFLTVDTSFADLPVESNSIRVTYEDGDDEKVIDLKADIVLCDGRSGCPPDPEEDL